MLKKSFFVILIIMLSSFGSNAQTHFSFAANTGESYSIVIDGATIDGQALDADDEIGVFTP